MKRKWKPAVVALACALTVEIGLSLAAFGPRIAWAEHEKWWTDGASGTTLRQLTNIVSVDEDRLTNQSVAVTLRRLLTRLGSTPGTPRDRVTLVEISPEQLKAVYLAVMGLLSLGIAIYCRRPGRAMTAGQWSNEIALIVLATLWFSPVVWSYHPTAAVPALALVLSRRSAYPRLIWVVIAIWLAGMVLLAFPLARAAGDLLWVSLLVGGALVWTARGAAGQAAGGTRCKQ